MQAQASFPRPELLQVADTVARDKGIDKDEVLEAMEQAIQKAGRSKYGQEYDIRAEIDRRSGEIRLLRFREVVEHREGRGPTAAPGVNRGGKKGAPTAVPALRAVPPVKRGSCRGSVVPGSPSGDPATDDPGSP